MKLSQLIINLTSCLEYGDKEIDFFMSYPDEKGQVIKIVTKELGMISHHKDRYTIMCGNGKVLNDTK